MMTCGDNSLFKKIQNFKLTQRHICKNRKNDAIQFQNSGEMLQSFCNCPGLLRVSPVRCSKSLKGVCRHSRSGMNKTQFFALKYIKDSQGNQKCILSDFKYNCSSRLSVLQITCDRLFQFAEKAARDSLQKRTNVGILVQKQQL